MRYHPLLRRVALGLLLAATLRGETVLLHHEATPPATYAARKLEAALERAGHPVISTRDASPASPAFLIELATDATLQPEAYSIRPDADGLRVAGGDARGLIYGALALVDQVRAGHDPRAIVAAQESAHLPFRAIKFNLPWDTYRSSSALDQHVATVKDLRFWEAFLDMMVENRFNVISLWNLHPYSYMIRARNFPEASPWSDAELAEWQQLFRGIFRLAKERGLDTYIVHWNIFISRALAEAHDVGAENFYPHYYGRGDTSQLVQRYLRESVTQLLEEYPDLDGLGISHGEGMGGMTPAARQQWIDDVLIAGMLDARRPSKLIHRVPFSSGTSSEPGVSHEVEHITRTAMDRLTGKFEGPIWVEMKFNWSHGHSTSDLVKVHGGPLGPTYFSPPPENYKVTWMMRNEDFFALRWGVPDFIRSHVELNAAAAYVGGYFIGSETYIPALDYFTALPHGREWTWAFERQWLFYKLWGRLLYNPKTSDEVFAAEFQHRYGPTAGVLQQALALASATQLRIASFYDSRWDFTLYSEGLLALQGDYTRYIGVDQLIGQPTLDPDYVSISDYVAAGPSATFAPEKITPQQLSEQLERDCAEALRLIRAVDSGPSVALQYELADIRAWAELGFHFAAKLRGAVDLAHFRRTGEPSLQAQAIAHLERAVAHWDRLVAITRPLYRDMPLTHYNHNFFVRNDDNLFHWARLRPEVAADIEVARTARPANAAAGR